MRSADNRWPKRTAAILAILGIVAVAIVWHTWVNSGIATGHAPPPVGGGRPASEIAATAGEPLAADQVRVDARRIVTGRLVWSDGVPISRASVRCELAAEAVYTDTDGRFELSATYKILEGARSILITAHPACWLHSEPPFSQRVACGNDAKLPDGRVVLGDLAVPATVDLELIFNFEGAATQMAKRAGYGIVSVRVGDANPALSGMLTGTVARTQIDLSDAPPKRVLRVPMRSVVEVAANLEPSTPWAVVAEHVATTTISLTRDKPAQAVVPFRSANLLMGRVVDHEGHPLRLANVKLEQVAAAEGGRLRITRTFDDGTFLVLGAAGETFTGVATFESARSPEYRLVVGNLEYELRCPTETLRRVRVRSGMTPVVHFEFAENSLLFGQRDPETPNLAEHPSGMGFLARRAKDLCRYLCWRERDGLREATVRIPPSSGDDIVDIDVNTLNVEPRGSLMISYGSEPRTLRIRRVLPAPDAGFQGFVGGAVSTDPRLLTGIPAGTYEVEVRVAGSHPFAPALASVQLELTAGRSTIDVEALLRRSR